MLNKFCRNPANNSPGFHIFANHCASGNYGPIANSYTSNYNSAGANPNIFANNYGRNVVDMPLIWWQAVVDSGQCNAVPNKRAIAYINAPLILKATAGIDKNIFSQPDNFAKIRIKRGE